MNKHMKVSQRSQNPCCYRQSVVTLDSHGLIYLFHPSASFPYYYVDKKARYFTFPSSLLAEKKQFRLL